MIEIADYTRYPEAFQKFGIKYTEEPGWRNRGHGDIVKVQFLVLHHTAGGNESGDIRVVRDGRSDLPGPLSQLVLKRDGNPHIIAQGVCWHAGYGPAMWGAPEGNGNYYSIGIEGVSNGYNDWTDAQRSNYPKVVAALLKDLGLPADRWIFHRDYNKRDGKIDPAGFDAAWFGREVNRWYNEGDKPKESAIQAKYRENPWLGKKITVGDELPCADSVGKFAEYEFGHIYWHPNFGARTINKNIWPKFELNSWEIGFLGYPVADAIKINGGEAQAFQNGSIYYSDADKQGYVLNGVIGSRWAELKWENGILGFPETDEITPPDGIGRLQRFKKGHIYFSPKTGAKEILYGPIWDEYARVGYEAKLGYPTGTAVATQDRRGFVQSFENGAIYNLTSTKDANAITGEIFKIYGQLGYENGRLGMPISDVVEKDGKRRANFEAGSIEEDTKTNDIYLVLSGKRVDIKRTG